MKKSIEIILVNDALITTQIPIAKFSISSFIIDLQQHFYDRYITSTFNLTAEYYNNNLISWEPMIEPFSINFNYHEAINPLLES